MISGLAIVWLSTAQSTFDLVSVSGLVVDAQGQRIGAALESLTKEIGTLVQLPADWLPTALCSRLGADVSETAIPSYLEIIDFIASGTTPQAVADYRPSPEAQNRVAELIRREKEGDLSAEEKSELDHFMDLENILRIAKARARQFLASAS